ncbi:STAS-like domain-containing protein [Alkalihalophilus lindianensis]|uniref:STAS-like domain-containing protein n=1 Tax=Alkalihalophilus lindianensis TaxID=1630542 RepID=A0ABU3X7I6_9BACI|nr:STAS-like domain-containing protein [Alkalihalophilus lindianensis]MDV2683789.1 STAS-like domain-containing protein [Alkalihalophilus lindianensis]MDV2683855.1 STAS-like domain-containing protein [Alkalihalophilus lindianensis]
MFSLAQNGSVLTERDLGAKIRSELLSIISAEHKVTVDLSNVQMVTSSFADELFAKLIEEIGPEAKSKVAIVNVSTTVRTIINEAIFTRSKLPQ